MINKTIICISILVLSYCITAAQNDINYQPNLLNKELAKVEISDYSLIKEIKFSDSSGLHSSLMGKYFSIESENFLQYKYIYVGRVNSCRSGICSNPTDRSNEIFSEYFDYFIIFDILKTVRVIKVFNYQASHGQEITNKGWLKQFIGYNGNQTLILGKNVDAISGATVSANALVLDIEQKVKLLQTKL